MQAVKDVIKTRYSSLMWRSGLLSTWLKVRPRRRDVAILCYHHVPAHVFADHLRALVQAYRVVTLDACRAYLGGEGDLPANAVVITFDDAYRQFHDEIYPILRQHGVPATVFVSTAAVQRQEVHWFNRVKALVWGTDLDEVRLGDRVVPVRGRRRSAYHETVRILNSHTVDERDALLADLLGGAAFSKRHLAMVQPMTWEQLRAMRGRVTYGAHTVTHPNLAMLDRRGIADEIMESKRCLEEQLGVDVNHFAYPFGRAWNINSDAVDVVREAGFACAVTMNRGSCKPGEDLFMLPRVACDGVPDGRTLATQLSSLWVFVST